MLFSFITGATAFLAGFLWTRLDLSWVMLPLLAVGIYLGLILAAFVFLLVLCALVDMKKPQEHDSPFYRKVMTVYIEALVSLVRIRFHTEGLDRGGRCSCARRGDRACEHLFPAVRADFITS